MAFRLFSSGYAEVMYAETQNGNIYVSLDGGFSFDDANGIDPDDRRDWDMQYIISPNPDVLYTGTFRAYRSTAVPSPSGNLSARISDGLVSIPVIITLPLLKKVAGGRRLALRGDRRRQCGAQMMPAVAGGKLKTACRAYVTSVKASPGSPIGYMSPFRVIKTMILFPVCTVPKAGATIGRISPETCRTWYQ